MNCLDSWNISWYPYNIIFYFILLTNDVRPGPKFDPDMLGGQGLMGKTVVKLDSFRGGVRFNQVGLGFD